MSGPEDDPRDEMSEEDYYRGMEEAMSEKQKNGDDEPIAAIRPELAEKLKWVIDESLVHQQIIGGHLRAICSNIMHREDELITSRVGRSNTHRVGANTVVELNGSRYTLKFDLFVTVEPERAKKP